MKKILIVFLLVTGFVSLGTADAAVTGTQRRGGGAATTVTRAPATAARSATPAARTTAARAAAVPRVTPAVSARAATTQGVIQTGTKVTTAAGNVMVSEACRNKYNGCMDSFCMVENSSGGRCLCNDRNAELNKVWAQIQELDSRAYEMATAGVEQIEMGSIAADIISNVNQITRGIVDKKEESKRPTARERLDFTSVWDNVGWEVEDPLANAGLTDPLADKTGAALHRTVHNLCVEQMPECAGDMSMLQMMYAQTINSDCTAYENELTRQKNAVAEKVATAERAMREAALDSFRTANKWDLGQCAVEFKNCMMTTAGCNDDFTGCVGIAAAENARSGAGARNTTKQFAIEGSATKIMIAASTMDTLLAKKPICDNVTNSCQRVAADVWTTFLREVGPQIKTAELAAESELRQSCIGNIAACFQRACRETIDPNDPDGSYDACLTRPEMVASLCKVQVEPCVAAEPLIMDYVNAKLASMRVDSCTSQVKDCLQSPERCGKDYTQCVGLDTDTIIKMCPADKLVGCRSAAVTTDDDIYTELNTLVQGIMLNIDNNMLNFCQKAADEAMIRVCGSTEDCNGIALSDGLGGHSVKYQVCAYDTNNELNTNQCVSSVDALSDTDLFGAMNMQTGQLIAAPKNSYAGAILGDIFWSSVDLLPPEIDDDKKFDERVKKVVDDYLVKLGLPTTYDDKDKNRYSEPAREEISQLVRAVDNAIEMIESDQTVKYCMTGRTVPGLKLPDDKTPTATARFKNLTAQMRMIIANGALKLARENYYKKYDEATEKMTADYVKFAERKAENTGNAMIIREMGRRACLAIAGETVSADATGPLWITVNNVMSGIALKGATIAAALTGVGGVDASQTTSYNVSLSGAPGELSATNSVNAKTLKKTVTSTYNWDTRECTVETILQTCYKEGKKNCSEWNEEKIETSIKQF